ncbi:hypothetical protein RIF29_14576 [Crotalaria pallida]|uniref:Uncharacterized protein n=1 Tax=Crotalaria pallida TaxID=3830 RepID=A0AAN9FBJ3_CROPI
MFGNNQMGLWGYGISLKKKKKKRKRRMGLAGHDGALTLSSAPFQGTWARSATEDASPNYNSNTEGERFSWWALPSSLAVTKGILRPPAQTQFSTNHALLAGSQHSPSSMPRLRPKLWGNDGRHPGRRALSLMALGVTS